jgi:hypothetical protein
MRKCNDEIYQLAKDQALVKKYFIKFKIMIFTSRKLSDQITDADEACRSSEISVNLIIIIVFF